MLRLAHAARRSPLRRLSLGSGGFATRARVADAGELDRRWGRAATALGGFDGSRAGCRRNARLSAQGGDTSKRLLGGSVGAPPSLSALGSSSRRVSSLTSGSRKRASAKTRSAGKTSQSPRFVSPRMAHSHNGPIPLYDMSHEDGNGQSGREVRDRDDGGDHRLDQLEPMRHQTVHRALHCPALDPHDGPGSRGAARVSDSPG